MNMVGHVKFTEERVRKKYTLELGQRNLVRTYALNLPWKTSDDCVKTTKFRVKTFRGKRTYLKRNISL